jgi:hypothetical protein
MQNYLAGSNSQIPVIDNSRGGSINRPEKKKTYHQA